MFLYLAVLVWVLTEALGIQFSDQGSNWPPTLGAWSLSHWTSRAFPIYFLSCAVSSLLHVGFLQLQHGVAALLWCTGFSHLTGRVRCMASHSRGFLLCSIGPRACGRQQLQRVGSMWVSSCDTWTQLLRGMLGSSLGLGIEPMSPALAGRFLTTRPPGKSMKSFTISCKADMLAMNSLNLCLSGNVFISLLSRLVLLYIEFSVGSVSLLAV